VLVYLNSFLVLPSHGSFVWFQVFVIIILITRWDWPPQINRFFNQIPNFQNNNNNNNHWFTVNHYHSINHSISMSSFNSLFIKNCSFHKDIYIFRLKFSSELKIELALALLRIK
jgi:hypothetical protein